MSVISEKAKKKYLKNHGNKCPHCGSTELNSHAFESDDNYAWRDVSCLECDEEWQDIYILTDVKSIIQPWEK